MGGSARGDGDWVGGCVLRNRCLHVNSAFAVSVQFPAHKAFAAREAITAAVLWLWWGVVVRLVGVEVDKRFKNASYGEKPFHESFSAFYRRQL